MIKSARVMKKAVGYLVPYMEEEKLLNNTQGDENVNMIQYVIEKLHSVGYLSRGQIWETCGV